MNKFDDMTTKFENKFADIVSIPFKGIMLFLDYKNWKAVCNL